MFQLLAVPIVAILLSSCSLVRADKIQTPKKKISLAHENTLLLLAMDYESQGWIAGSSELLLNLFQKTGNPEYATEYLQTLNQLKKHKTVIKKFYEFNLSGDQNLKELAKAYFFIDEVENSEKAILKIKNLDAQSTYILARIYLKKNLINKAVLTLDYYHKNSKFSFEISNNLANIYNILSKYQKSLEVYQEIYKHKKTQIIEIKIFQALRNLGKYDEIVNFLEETQLNNKVLIEIYLNMNKLEKGYKLSTKLYKQTKDKNYLFQSLIFQEKINKRDENNNLKYLILIIKDMEITIIDIEDDPMYLNYLGYLMLENNYNIKSGIKYIKKAVKLAPKDMMILDSLAYGYFLLGNCDSALKEMSKVVDKLGLKESDIAKHWQEIKSCKERK